ncbi:MULTISPECIES: SurA N-terminal domain-containing protein [Halomonas]|uniref:Periplasmic chaperone PpiD n=1 Tax=Halomonas halophila TaxID=29573 RepID=A0ABQ0U784_9GAMM|nr:MULTISPECIES: SurA N-terminal domain-containing protein [Halomonas]MDR5890235.1 SurA N-terminal domain-containing protein [Halomonas salina]WJY05846.1 SurA N-terminal domain-containing protein [Halomonas halophila]GEK72889.1 peptidylprolyl isomerase [Halomonas halophila]
MLQSIRDRSTSWGAKILVGAVVVTMALFGVESLVGLLNSDGEEVATVNGEPITRQQLELQVQRAIRSGQVPPEQERQLRAETLDSLITNQLLTQYAEEGGLHLSDAQIDQLIVTLPEFQDANGRFDSELFKNRLASAGFTPISFRAQLREDMKRRQLQQGLVISEFSLPSEQERLAELQRQARTFRHYALTPADLEAAPDIDDADLQAYYEAHADAYQRPEQVKLAYVVLDKQAMAEDVEVSDEDLRQAWQDEAASADRRVSHIMVSFGDERSREDAGARLEEVKSRLADGEAFADLAADYSDDTSTSDAGGDLGVIGRGFFGEAFEDAAFALDEGQVSDIVETDNGLHLIQVTELDRPPFEEARDRLRQDVALAQVEDAFNDKAQRLIDESFAAEDLASVAEDLGLERRQSDWVSRDDVDGVLSEPGVMRQAFSDDVLEEGFNSEVIELDEDRRMVLRVVEHRDATTLPLDEVRDRVVAAVEAEKTREALEARADEMLASLRGGETLGLDWQRAESLSRQAESGLAQPVIEAAFRLPHPSEGETVYGRANDGQRVVLIGLESVTEGEANAQIESFVARMAQQLRSQAAVNGLLDHLREQAEIERP